MRNYTIEQETVDEVLEQFAGNEDIFQSRGISATRRFSLANAAAATSVSTDELRAVLDYRTRRNARQHQQVEEDEAEFVV